MNIPDNLKQDDLYSLMLFALYKMKDDANYSTLSQLIYILDRESTLKLCEYYGGMTIKIPTIEELEILTYALLLYQLVDIEKKSYEEITNSFNVSKAMLSSIVDVYSQLSIILSSYKFREQKNDSE